MSDRETIGSSTIAVQRADWVGLAPEMAAMVAPPVIVRRGLGDPARLGLAADDGEAVEVN